LFLPNKNTIENVGSTVIVKRSLKVIDGVTVWCIKDIFDAFEASKDVVINKAKSKFIGRNNPGTGFVFVDGVRLKKRAYMCSLQMT
jgi:hypothetical protein